MSELKRIEALEEYDILDSTPEKEFNEIIELASAMFGAPISFISLIESERQWFKAIKGLSVNEAERKHAFCNYTIDQPEGYLIINDAVNDHRFVNNPYVVDNPKIRSYAGAALATKDGYHIGTICVIDNKPRNFDEKDAALLKIISNRVMVLLELRKENIKKHRELSLTKDELDLTLDRLIEAQSIAGIGSWDWDLGTNDLYWSPEMYRIYGIQPEEENLFEKWMSKVHHDDVSLLKNALIGALKEGINASIEYRIICDSGKERWLEAIGTVKNVSGAPVKISGTVQDVSKRKNAEIKQGIYLKTLKDIMFDISHKIRQPLSNSLGLVDTLVSHDLSEEEIKKFAQHLKLSIHQMDAYVREMSDAIFSSQEEIDK
ncbi:MAG: PAS domain-containing protein [Ekhidna sp.]